MKHQLLQPVEIKVAQKAYQMQSPRPCADQSEYRDACTKRTTSDHVVDKKHQK